MDFLVCFRRLNLWVLVPFWGQLVPPGELKKRGTRPPRDFASDSEKNRWSVVSGHLVYLLIKTRRYFYAWVTT
jgi:hypothetical protein